MPHIGGGFNRVSHAVRFGMLFIRHTLVQPLSKLCSCTSVAITASIRPTRHRRLNRIRIISLGIADKPQVEQG